MCRCTPEIRTPFCGRPGCEWPHEEEKPAPPMRLLTLPLLTGRERALTVQADLVTRETWIGSFAAEYTPRLTPSEVRCIIYALQIVLEHMRETAPKP